MSPTNNTHHRNLSWNQIKHMDSIFSTPKETYEDEPKKRVGFLDLPAELRNQVSNSDLLRTTLLITRPDILPRLRPGSPWDVPVSLPQKLQFPCLPLHLPPSPQRSPRACLRPILHRHKPLAQARPYPNVSILQLYTFNALGTYNLARIADTMAITVQGHKDRRLRVL